MKQMTGLTERLTRPLRERLGDVARRVVLRGRRYADRLDQGSVARFGLRAGTLALAAVLVHGFWSDGSIGRTLQDSVKEAGLGVERVDVAGNEETSALAVLEVLQIDGAALVPSVDIAAARERVAELPWVAEASVRRVYPNALAVQLEERRAFALWQKDEAVSLIDENGRIIAPFDDLRFAELPLVVGAGANENARDLVALLDAHEAIAERIKAAVYVGGRRWNLIARSGIEVRLPEANVEAALADLSRLDREHGLMQRDVVAIDLRLPDRLILKLPEMEEGDDGSPLLKLARDETRT